MDNGVNLPFDSSGHDFATFGMPIWTDGWHQVILVGSKPMALSDPSKGGRMLFEIKNIDPASPDNGKAHAISLNLYHNDPATKKRAEDELASICFVTNTPRFNNTAELYNKPFYVLAQTSVGKPTPAYPNPTPQTNFRGYRNVAGQEPSKQGGAPAGGQAPQFAPQGQSPQFAPQGAPGGFAPQGGAPAFQQPGAPQFGAPQGGPAPSFQQPQTFQQPGQPGGFGQPQQPGAGAPSFGQPAPTGFAPQQPQNPANGFQPPQTAQFPSNPGQPQQFVPQGQPQQFQQPGQPQQFAQPGQPQQQPQQAWAPQTGGGPAPWGPQQ